MVGLDLLLQPCLDTQKVAVFQTLALGLPSDLSELLLHVADQLLQLLQLHTVAVLCVLQGLLQGCFLGSKRRLLSLSLPTLGVRRACPGRTEEHTTHHAVLSLQLNLQLLHAAPVLDHLPGVLLHLLTTVCHLLLNLSHLQTQRLSEDQAGLGA